VTESRGGFPDCFKFGCRGCLGMLLSCGHSYRCVRDPALGKHRCAVMWTPMLEAIVFALGAALVAWMLASK
jgi:hypothetical protein